MLSIILVGSPFGAFASSSDTVKALCEETKTHLGKPYIFGTAGEKTFDCSGLVLYCFDKVCDIAFPHSAYEIGYNDSLQKIESIEDLLPGDIVCFNTIFDKDRSDHVGIFIGENQFVHASSKLKRVVISSFSIGKYSELFSWGRRVIVEGGQ